MSRAGGELANASFAVAPKGWKRTMLVGVITSRGLPSRSAANITTGSTCC